MLVELNRVSKKYALGDNQVCALNSIDLSINHGEFIVLKGNSGSGKSTLLNLISALDDASQGEVRIQGHSIQGLNERQRARLRLDYVGIVFQSFNLIPVLTALENVMYPLTLKGISAADARQRAQRALQQVQLADQLHQRPVHLSGGQMQRVAIARALVTEPALILADEPTANLDSNTAHTILELMQELNQQQNITFIIATHDEYVMTRASRIITLKDGLLIQDDTQSPYFSSERMKSTV
jgi:putative ABC transport system ATP-binding protein